MTRDPSAEPTREDRAAEEAAYMREVYHRAVKELAENSAAFAAARMEPFGWCPLHLEHARRCGKTPEDLAVDILYDCIDDMFNQPPLPEKAADDQYFNKGDARREAAE